LNSELSLSLAETLANRVSREASTTEERIGRAFLLTVGRLPSKEELAWSNGFLREEESEKTNDKHGALTRFCLALFNANEFLYVD